MLEKTLESPLDCKEIQPVHPKGNQSWVFIGRTDAEAETPILWPPHVKSWLIGKDPESGKDLGQEEKGETEGEMAGWPHQLDGHGFWVDSRSWWWTGRPGMLRFVGSQRAGHNWAIELNCYFWSQRKNEGEAEFKEPLWGQSFLQFQGWTLQASGSEPGIWGGGRKMLIRDSFWNF